MIKPYISVTQSFNPVTYCSRKHPHPIAIIHVKDYDSPSLDVYKEDGCNVQGLFHLNFDCCSNDKRNLTEDLAEKAAKFIKKMLERDITYLYVFYHYSDKLQADSVGKAIVDHIHPKQFKNGATQRKVDLNAYNTMKNALIKQNVPQINS